MEHQRNFVVESKLSRKCEKNHLSNKTLKVFPDNKTDRVTPQKIKFPWHDMQKLLMMEVPAVRQGELINLKVIVVPSVRMFIVNSF